MTATGRAVTLIPGLAYPLLVYLILNRWGVVELGVLTLLAGLARVVMVGFARGTPRWRPDTLGVVLVVLGVVILSSQAAFAARLYPVLVNFGALAYFSWTLVHPPSAIERIARLADPALPDYAVAYTRRVTFVWSVFFLVNGCAAFYTAVWASMEAWTLYNGIIAYLLMGLLFAGEYLFRRRVRAAYESADA